jgi:hypothetical protein
VTFEPGADLGVLVGGVVVEDDVHDLACGDVALQRVEEADELLMAVSWPPFPWTSICRRTPEDGW